MNTSEEKTIIWFEDLRKEDIPLVGGKCANLGEMISAGIPVPPGFAVTAQVYKKFIEETGIEGRIFKTIKEADPKDPAQLQEASKKVRELIESTPVPEDIKRAITQAYEKLGERVGLATISVAVRSSATAEDLPDASFAGQQETYLNVKGAEELIEKVRKCWGSLFTPRAIFYRVEKGFKHEIVLLSVAVQKMVNAKAAGVLFTIHPATGEADKVIIEANWGLGESVVSGSVTPDRFIVDKNKLEILERQIAAKKIEYVRDPKTGKTVHSEIPPERRDIPCLTDDEVKKLAELGKLIERHYGRAQDIEFAIDRDEPYPQNVYIVQSRAETVWSTRTRERVGLKLAAEHRVVTKGLAASPGVGAGKAKVAMSTAEASKLMEKGNILVTELTNPDWVPYMKLATSIVTDSGGLTCHAAIVSREMGIPCIVGTRNATEIMQTGNEYTVDAEVGNVYEGLVEEVLTKRKEVGIPKPEELPRTKSKVYVNLSIPELADKVHAETLADGVGLLRAEHMMLGIGKHPRLLIEEGGEQLMVDQFAGGVAQVAKAFHPGPVVYRFLDFKPDEFLGMPGGEKYEREAGHVGPNPLIGYRGCFRYVKEPDIFRLECKAIKKVREEYGLKNVWVMVPFVRTIQEFREARRIMEEEGLRRGPDFKLWIMCEVPSTVLLIDKFIDEGIDGISFGTNDLTMLILGIDRDDASIQEIYDERNLAVLRAMSHVIRICKERGVTTSICGQAPSNYPEIVEFLLAEGATSLSVNPDKVVETRLLVAKIEEKLKAGGKPERIFAPQWSKKLT
ncbi:MAG: phosphoenolpyruvate synthase [Candidatus Hodarchaeaceae archaeon]|nr:phosphoenolpyruvate synthase [Candidatus Hodarchaeaceae archaeon]